MGGISEEEAVTVDEEECEWPGTWDSITDISAFTDEMDHALDETKSRLKSVRFSGTRIF